MPTSVATTTASAAPDSISAPYDTSGAAVLRLASSTVLNEKNAARTLGLPLGCLVTPVPSAALQLPVSGSPAAACFSCGANLNVHCKIDPRTGSWQCCFCKQSNKEARPLHDIQACPEVAHEAVEYHMNRSDNLHQSTVHDSIAFVLDTTAAHETLEAMKTMLLQGCRSRAGLRC